MPVTINGAAMLRPEQECRVVHAACMGDDGAQYLCPTARFAPYISSQGRLLPCMPISMCAEQEAFPMIQEKGLAACLTDSAFMSFVSLRKDDLFARNPVCGSCEQRHSCGGGCRAAVLQDTHDFFACDAYRCLIWKEGYRDKLTSALKKAQQAAAAEVCHE